MYYRITDWKNEPRGSGYNSTTFEELANGLYEIDPLFFYESDTSIELLIECLENGERDFVGFLIEESETPFDTKDLDF